MASGGLGVVAVIVTKTVSGAGLLSDSGGAKALRAATREYESRKTDELEGWLMMPL